MGEEARAQLQLEIEPMRVRDLDEIMAIEHLCFPTPWSRAAFLSELLENDRAYYLVARLNGRIVGYCGMWVIIDEGHITNLAVHPDNRSKGIGRRLLEAVSDLAKRKKVTKLTLEVRKSNTVALKLYTDFGFVACGVRKGYYRDNNEDAIIMWKDI